MASRSRHSASAPSRSARLDRDRMLKAARDDERGGARPDLSRRRWKAARRTREIARIAVFLASDDAFLT